MDVLTELLETTVAGLFSNSGGSNSVFCPRGCGEAVFGKIAVVRSPDGDLNIPAAGLLRGLLIGAGAFEGLTMDLV